MTGTQSILLCAQHPGHQGWGHFSRLLTLKRILSSSIPHSLCQKILLGTLLPLGEKEAHTPVSKQHAWQHRPSELTTTEYRACLFFRTPQELKTWLDSNAPRLILFDVREHAMTLLPALIKKQQWVLVCDSRHPHAKRLPQLLFETLPQLPTKTAHKNARANFQLPWERLCPASPQKSRSLLPLPSPFTKNADSRILLYIGGITKDRYWKTAFKTLIALVFVHALNYLKKYKKLPAPCELIIIVDARKKAKLLWKLLVLSESVRYAKRFATILGPSFGAQLATELTQVCTFPKRMDAATFKHGLAQSTYVLTHPGLSAQSTLHAGRPLMILAPTAPLSRIAQFAYAPFFTKTTLPFMKVMNLSRRETAAAAKKTLAQATALLMTIAREAAKRKLPKLSKVATSSHKADAEEPSKVRSHHLPTIIKNLLQQDPPPRKCTHCLHPKTLLHVCERHERYNTLRCPVCKHLLRETLLSE